MMKKFFLILLILAAGIAVYFALGKVKSNYSGNNKNHDNQYNVLLITIDTLRADRLGCYGYTEMISPEIDKISKESIRFENAIIQAPYTGPSHSSILTGKYISNHGVLTNGYKLPPENVTLAEILKEYGYTTGASIGAWVLKKMYNYDQGFDVFMESKKSERRAAEVNKDLLGWIKRNRNKKIFAWAHYYDVHCPYYPPKKFRKRFSENYKESFSTEEKCGDTYYNGVKLQAHEIEHIRKMYDAEVAYTDSKIGQVLRKLKKWGLFDNTVIIITSDHGEELYEHGKIGHNYMLYDYEIKVPLLIRYPGMKSKDSVVFKQIESISIMPTILEILAIPAPEGIDGKGFLGILEGQDVDESPAFVRTASQKNAEHEYAIRTNDTKIIYSKSKEKELYNLKEDPGEKDNVILRIDNTNDITELETAIQKFISKEENANKIKNQKVEEETVKKLKTLGYVQ